LVPAITTISKQTLTGYVLATLYLMGPLAGVMTSFSLFSRAEVALRKVESLGFHWQNIRLKNARLRSRKMRSSLNGWN